MKNTTNKELSIFLTQFQKYS